MRPDLSTGLSSAAAAAPFGVAWVALGDVVRMALRRGLRPYPCLEAGGRRAGPAPAARPGRFSPSGRARDRRSRSARCAGGSRAGPPLPLLLFLSVGSPGASVRSPTPAPAPPCSRRLLRRILRSLAPGRQARDTRCRAARSQPAALPGARRTPWSGRCSAPVAGCGTRARGRPPRCLGAAAHRRAAQRLRCAQIDRRPQRDRPMSQRLRIRVTPVPG